MYYITSVNQNEREAMHNQLIQAIVIIAALFALPWLAGELSFWLWQLIKLINEDYYNKMMSN